MSPKKNTRKAVRIKGGTVKSAGVRRPKVIPSPDGKSSAPAASPFFGPNWLLALLFVWVAAMAALFNLPNYRLMLPESLPLPQLPLFWTLGITLAVLTLLWRLAPTVPENQWDLSPWTARAWFWVLMGLGAWLRLRYADQAAPGFWDDHAWIITDIRDVVDFKTYPLLFPFGWREAFFPYLSVFLWYLFPHAIGVPIVHYSSAIIDLLALWAFYLAGKEVGGRRMGILVLAMGAISKSMIEVCFFGYGSDTTVTACAFSLLFFLRMVKKPDWKHFLYWGLAMGFGAYCYVPFRIWTPFLLGAAWLWVYSHPGERSKDPFRLLLGLGGMATLVLLFGVKNSFLPADHGLLGFLTTPVMAVLSAVVLLFSYVRVGRQGIDGEGRRLFGWATGALTTVLCMMPLFLNPNYSSHVSDLSILNKTYSPTAMDALKHLWDNTIYGFVLMFGPSNGLQCPGVGDSFFDFAVAAAGLLGLATFIARPTWVKAFLIALCAVSFLPFILSGSPHTFRLVAIDAPLIFIGAWGLNRLWLAFIQVGSPKIGGAVCGLLLILLGIWHLQQNNVIFQKWLTEKGSSVIVQELLDKETPTHRAYLFQYPNFWSFGQGVLCDGQDVYRTNPTNDIDLVEGERGKDLTLVIHGSDLDMKKKLDKEFPGLVWQEQNAPWATPFMRWAEVPIDKVPEKGPGMFHLHRFPASSWLRRCYRIYGMGRGMILYEDRVIHWNDIFNTLPNDAIADYNSMRVTGVWDVKKEGEYSFSIQTANAFWLSLDGDKILSWDSGPAGNVKRMKRLRLSRGPHQVELVTRFNFERSVPTVFVTQPGSGNSGPLDDLAAQTTLP